MTAKSPVDHTPLFQQVLDVLVERIQSGVYPPESQLPPEHQLAAEFAVSRATIRSAIDSLVSRDMIVRKRGIGTFISQLATVTNPISFAYDFQDNIARQGFKPGFESTYFGKTHLSEEVAKDLHLEAGALAYTSHKIFTADGQPVIYCVNTMPARLFSPELLEQLEENSDLIEPMHGFLRDYCGQPLEYYVCQLRPSTVAECDFHGGLPLDDCLPLLVFDEIGYNIDEQPVLHTVQYYPENQMRLQLVRHLPK